MKNRGNTGKKRAKGDRGQAEGSSNLSSGVKPTPSVAGVIPEGAVAPATNGTTSGTGLDTQPHFSVTKKSIIFLFRIERPEDETYLHFLPASTN